MSAEMMAAALERIFTKDDARCCCKEGYICPRCEGIDALNAYRQERKEAEDSNA